MKGAKHLIRLAAVYLLGTLSFLGLRSFFVPHSFGEYGHYRGDAIGEIASLPVHFAGHDSCESCHTDQQEEKSKGKHAKLSCEACHGPQAKHANADDPGTVMPPKPNAAVLCAQCHEASAAKPQWFPQVASVEHAGGDSCISCHSPHNPTEAPAEAGAKKK